MKTFRVDIEIAIRAETIADVSGKVENIQLPSGYVENSFRINHVRIVPDKREETLKRVTAYVKDKMRLFGSGDSKRSRGITEALQNIKYILDDKI